MGYQTCVTSTGEMFTSLRIMYLAHSTIAMDMGAAFMGKVLLFRDAVKKKIAYFQTMSQLDLPPLP